MTEWRPVPEFEDTYAVSDSGTVMRTSPGRRTSVGFIQRPSLHKDGYWLVKLFRQGTGRTVYVHRLVALAFLGNPAQGQRVVRHLDGNPQNNTVENLRWGTHKENSDDRKRHGRDHGWKFSKS